MIAEIMTKEIPSRQGFFIQSRGSLGDQVTNQLKSGCEEKGKYYG